MRTKAVIFTGKNRVEFGEVDVPDPGPNDVMVATKHSWISNGTEGSFLRCERLIDWITAWKPGLPEPYPLVPGYQKVGIVESVGRDVKSIQEGQWVFATLTTVNGVKMGCGGHVARGPSSASEVYALPQNDDPVPYSGLVLTQVGYNGGSRAPVGDSSCALVMGDGMVGNWAAQTLQLRNARVALVGKHGFRLKLLKPRAGDIVLNVGDSDWLERALDWAGGQFDIIVDTVGNEVNFDLNMQLLSHMRHNGHFVTVGHEGDKCFIDLRPFIQRECTIHCPAGWSRPRLETVLALVHEKKLDTASLITDRLPARQAAEAWRRIFEKKDSTLGVVLDWE